MNVDTMAASAPLREVLSESISSGRFEDTKIILYTRRDSFGTVCGPRALYASSRVLRTIPHFDDRKSESPPVTTLEDRAVNNAPRVLFGTFAEAGSKDFSDPIDGSASAEDYNYCSDSDLEEVEYILDSGGFKYDSGGVEHSSDSEAVGDFAIPARDEDTSNKPGPLRRDPFDAFYFYLGDTRSRHAYGEREAYPEKGKVIKIQDVAYVTYASPTA